jgi:hypothetical protein
MRLKKFVLLLVHDVESTEVIGLMPYLGPEFIAAILKRESTAAVDVRLDSKSATKTSLSALRFQSVVDGPRYLVTANLRLLRRVCISRLEPRKGKHHVFDIL